MTWLSDPRPPAEGAPSTLLRSQALQALLQALRPGSDRTVLDLGPPLQANVRFLAARSGRVRIADLHRSLGREPVESRRPESVGTLLERLLPLAPGERFSAILAWDVFDYMRADEARALMARLAPACHAETPVLVLASTRREIPAVPLRYRILDETTLACEGTDRSGRPCPRHTQGDLRRMMPGFSVRHSVLLRSGTQEFLFVREAGDDASRTRGIGAGRGGSAPYRWLREGPL